jgi:hypothetical protein
VPVLLPEPRIDKASHALCLAASGSGKTVMMSAALVEEVQRSLRLPLADRPAIFAIAPKEDLAIGMVSGLLAEAGAAAPHVHYLNPFQVGFPFNLAVHAKRSSIPLDIIALQLATLVSTVSTGLGAQGHLGIGSRQLDVLTNVILAAMSVPHPRATVLLALDALTAPDGPKRLSIVARSPRAARFLANAVMNDELRSSCASRLRMALGLSADIERMVSVPDCVSIDALTAPGQITILDIGQPTGGFLPLQSFFANLFVRLVVDHLTSRPSPWPGHHVRVAVDEAQLVAPVLSDVAELLLTTGRSRGISLILMSQGTSLIHDASPTLLKVLLTNTPFRLIGRLAASDADLFAREQAPLLGVDEPISAVRTRLSALICNLPDRHFLALSPGAREQFITRDVDLARWNAALTQHGALLSSIQQRYAVPATDQRLTLDDLIPPTPRIYPHPSSPKGGPTQKTTASPPAPRASSPPAPPPRQKKTSPAPQAPAAQPPPSPPSSPRPPAEAPDSVTSPPPAPPRPRSPWG